MKATAGPRGGGPVNSSCVGGAAEEEVCCLRKVGTWWGVGVLPWCLICVGFLFWNPKQKVFQGLPTRGGESIFPYPLGQGWSCWGGWAVAAILNFMLRNLVARSCSSDWIFYVLVFELHSPISWLPALPPPPFSAKTNSNCRDGQNTAGLILKLQRTVRWCENLFILLCVTRYILIILWGWWLVLRMTDCRQLSSKCSLCYRLCALILTSFADLGVSGPSVKCDPYASSVVFAVCCTMACEAGVNCLVCFAGWFVISLESWYTDVSE